MSSCLLCAIKFLSVGIAFDGTFFRGEERLAAEQSQLSFLQLLDVARRQYASNETEWQSINQLYRGDWDGLMEGPTWGAWWTQNSFGPTMGGLPFLGAVTWAATQHSMAWWFDSIGDGVSVGITNEGPAPDGCLCDAATPCAPPANRSTTCAYYKQGDGVVPEHDWTVEETLSGVVMMAEMLLVARNASGAAHFLPLFMRTSDWLETRRESATGNTTFFLTGPSTNLLAPSWGGGPGADGRAYLAGVSITYAAALSRMVELARLVGDDAVAVTAEARRVRAMSGLGGFLQRNSTADGHYFVRSVDRGTEGGARHGVLGAARFGYFEASPNHDAVAWRVVNDTLAEQIMGQIDALGAALRPNTFILPNSDAGGGGGYDDMLCADGKPYCDGNTRGGIFKYGQWVNGGCWTTQEARAMLAYFRTGRADAAAASMRFMLQRYSRGWLMDAPLTNFGLNTWASLPTMLTVDAFGCAAALMRGLFEYLYSATSLTLLPHQPDRITRLEQKFGVRWGPYRLYLSTAGVRSSGVLSVTINGVAAPAAHSINATAVVLDFAAMPPPSAAAAAATSSDVSTASDPVYVHIKYKDNSGEDAAAAAAAAAAEATVASPPPLPSGYVLRLRARDLLEPPSGNPLKPGDPVTVWASAAPAATVAAALRGYTPPTLALDSAAQPFVRFTAAAGSALGGSLALAAASTTLAVLRAQNATNSFATVAHFENDRGLAVSPAYCAGGNPTAATPCDAGSELRLAVDYSGSPNFGKRNIRGKLVVASVAYGATNGTSAVDGCTEQAAAGQVVSVPGATSSTTFTVGNRADGHHRQFLGHLYELIVYNRTLGSDELAAAAMAMRSTHSVAPRDCSATPAPTPAPTPPPTPLPNLNCTALRASCNTGAWPRKCGLDAAEEARLHAFVAALERAGTVQVASLPYEMARSALDYTAGFSQRCTALNTGVVPSLASATANEQSLTSLLTTGGNLFEGLNNALTTRYNASGAEPLALALAAAWKATAN
eukprot:g2666.t1